MESTSRESRVVSAERSLTRDTIIALVIGAVFFIGVLVAQTVYASEAQAEPNPNAPYGGCREAWPHYLDTEGADWCRKHGWTLRPRLMVGRGGWVLVTQLPRCKAEDGSYGPLPCSWNFDGSDGNGKGRAYWFSGTNEHPFKHIVRGVR